MITEYGYSKDPNIVPDGIVITFGKEMMIEQGGVKEFLSGWLNIMANENDYWKHFMRNVPTKEFLYVYVIILNRLAYRVNFVGFEAATLGGTRYKANGEVQPLEKRGILIAGPVVKCPFKRTLKGFQGFRYSTKLF